MVTEPIPRRIPITFHEGTETSIYVGKFENEIAGMAERDWSIAFLTVVPDRVIHDKRLISTAIREPVGRTFDRLTTRVVRKCEPIYPGDKQGFPFLIGAVGLPRPDKWLGDTLGRSQDHDAGLCFRGLLAIPRNARLRSRTVRDHFIRYDHLYRRGGGIARIDARSVPTPDIWRVMRHCFDTVVRRDLSLDEGLIALPQILPKFGH